MTKPEIKSTNDGVIGIIHKDEDIKIQADFNISVLCRVLKIVSLCILLATVIFMSKIGYVAFAVCCGMACAVALVGFVVSKGSERMLFYVTDEHIVSTTLFGNTRYFPIEEIQLVRLSVFSSITLASKDNKIVACFIKNRKEISRMINKLAIDK